MTLPHSLQGIVSYVVLTAGTAGASTGAISAQAVRHLGSVQDVALDDNQNAVRSGLSFCLGLVRRKYGSVIQGQLGLSDMVQLVAFCGFIQGIRVWRRRSALQEEGMGDAGYGERKDSSPTKGRFFSSSTGSPKLDAESTDPGLLQKHSSFKPYTTSFATYPSIRTFYRPHPQADKLPSKPTPLPLLVFIHGLGGSLAQFHPLLTSLVNVAPCLGIDLPGCGRSAFSPASWNAYTTKALAELIGVVIRQQCSRNLDQGVILIGHSMGCSLAASVATSIQSVNVLALIGICPQATPPSDDQVLTFEKLLRIPTPIFNMWRTWDRRGGPESASVARFVGAEADIEVKKLQEKFNFQSQTGVWRRMAWGALPSRKGSTPERGLAGLDVWASLKIPLFLVGGDGDKITKTDQVVKIGRALGKVDRPQTGESTLANSPFIGNTVEQPSQDEESQHAASKTEVTVIGETLPTQPDTPSYSKTRRVLKTSILPSPASHALLYDPATYRTVAGLIHTFLSKHVDTRLSLGWQLQHLSTEGKWDVKNVAKWQAVPPVSGPIAGIFRAMKTLRAIDDTHSPDIFVRNWKGKIKAIIDISHESPVYDPKGLEEGGIAYHKFPTVSKIPPTPKETEAFIRLVDRLRTSSTTSSSSTAAVLNPEALIGVHCHYGYNRTGFFICCYLIEREGYGVQQAIDEFATRRAPGIRHEHFLDQLFVRYCVGLRRAPTL